MAGIHEIYTPDPEVGLRAARHIYLVLRANPGEYQDVIEVLLAEPEFCDRFPRARAWLQQQIKAG